MPDAPLAADEVELLAGALELELLVLAAEVELLAGVEVELLAGADADEVDEPPPQAARSRAAATADAATQARGRVMMVKFMGFVPPLAVSLDIAIPIARAAVVV